MAAQAFLYNAVFFTYGVVLVRYEHAAPASVGLYLLPLALGNFCGPLALGHLFDTIGRRQMIFATYAISAVVLAVSAALFSAGALNEASRVADSGSPQDRNSAPSVSAAPGRTSTTPVGSSVTRSP